MVENDAQGKVIGYKPGKTIHLVRNPNWVKDKDFRPAYVDEILIRTNATDGNVTGRQVLSGSHLVLDRPGGAGPQAGRPEPEGPAQDGSRAAASGTFPLTTTIKPLDDINVRKAIPAAFDRDAARKARGGEFVGPIATHFIPPGIDGFEDAGGQKGPGFDFLAEPKGDMAVAEKYMKAAGYSSGKYDGNEELLMVGSNVDPGKAVAEVSKAQFEKLGFKIRLRTVPQDAVYTSGASSRPRRSPSAPALRGSRTSTTRSRCSSRRSRARPSSLKGGNINYSPARRSSKIDKAMDDAALLAGEERYQAWGEIDKMITEQAAAVPFVWDDTNLIHSKDVNGVINEYYSSFDFSFTSLK